MIAVPPIDYTATGVLVSSTAADEAAWAVGTTYALDAVVSKNRVKYTSLQAANLGKDPETEPLWWLDSGPSNKWAMFDSSVQTASTVTTNLDVVLKVGRATAVGLMGLIGQTVTFTMRDGSGGTVIDTYTQTLRSSDGGYYSFCFEDFVQTSDVVATGLFGAADGHLTISITGTGTVACGLCVVGKQTFLGNAEYGFSMNLEDRGRSYLDSLGNPVSIDRGYSKGCSGTLISSTADFNRLMAFCRDHIDVPCLWVATPDISDLVSATVFGKLARVVPALRNHGQVTSSIEISGYR